MYVARLLAATSARKLTSSHLTDPSGHRAMGVVWTGTGRPIRSNRPKRSKTPAAPRDSGTPEVTGSATRSMPSRSVTVSGTLRPVAWSADELATTIATANQVRIMELSESARRLIRAHRLARPCEPRNSAPKCCDLIRQSPGRRSETSDDAQHEVIRNVERQTPRDQSACAHQARSIAAATGRAP